MYKTCVVPYAVYVTVAPPAIFLSPLAALTLADSFSAGVDCPVARSGVTGGMELAGVAFGPGSSMFLDFEVVNALVVGYTLRWRKV